MGRRNTIGFLLGTGSHDFVSEDAAALRYGLMSILVLAIVAIVAVFVSRSIVTQLGGEPAAAIELMSRAASGDLTVDVRSSSRGSILDSAGEMVRAIRKMVSEITHSSTALRRR